MQGKAHAKDVYTFNAEYTFVILRTYVQVTIYYSVYTKTGKSLVTSDCYIKLIRPASIVSMVLDLYCCCIYFCNVGICEIITLRCLWWCVLPKSGR